MNKLEKMASEAELKKIECELLTYANKDELAKQVVTRTTADDAGDYTDENTRGGGQ